MFAKVPCLLQLIGRQARLVLGGHNVAQHVCCETVKLSLHGHRQTERGLDRCGRGEFSLCSNNVLFMSDKGSYAGTVGVEHQS